MKLSAEDIAKYNEVIKILGEEKIDKLYFIMGAQRFSIATVKYIIKKKKILSSIKNGTPVNKMISQIGSSNTAIYRYLQNGSKKNSRFEKNRD